MKKSLNLVRTAINISLQELSMGLITHTTIPEKRHSFLQAMLHYFVS
jgi:hypothetical protein